MRCLLALAVLSMVTSAAAQPDADRALVARVYADLAAGDVAAVAAVLDDHVVWTEHAHAMPAARHVGRGTVAARVLALRASAPEVPDSLTAESGRVVATGTATRDGRAIPFRHVWRLLDGRIVGVERTLGPSAGAPR